MKAYTDLPQSRTLAEFLHHESADQTWECIAIAGVNLDVPDELQYRHNGNMPFKCYSGIGVPCWSLAALLNILPYPQLSKDKLGNDGYGWMVCAYPDDCKYETFWQDNAVDACYEMIIELHEQKLI